MTDLEEYLKLIESGKCEVCGAKAELCNSETIVYTGPLKIDADGRVWPDCHTEGPLHFYCRLHEKESDIVDRFTRGDVYEFHRLKSKVPA